MARLSKIHQRVNDRAALKERLANGETPVAPVTADTLMTDDAELRRVFDELDARGEVPSNTFWDEARNSYSQIREVLDTTNLAMAEELQSFVKDPERTAKLAPHQGGRLTVLVNQVGQDVGRYYKELDEIYEQHKDKSGGVKNGDEAMQMLEVQNEYQSKALLFNKLVTPLVDEINQIIGVTERAAMAMAEAATRLPIDEAALGAAIQAEQAKQAAIDPTVVTDAQIKE